MELTKQVKQGVKSQVSEKPIRDTDNRRQMCYHIATT